MKKANLLTITAFATSLIMGVAPAVTAAATDKPAGSQGAGMMGSQGDGMTGMMMGPHQAQMSRMVDNCNRMMEKGMRGGPAVPSAPSPGQKG